MLLQSHAGCLDLLPSLPDAWASGSVDGLRARGNFGVDIQWTGGKLLRARITSGSGETCSVRYGSQTTQFPTKRGRVYIVTSGADGQLHVAE